MLEKIQNWRIKREIRASERSARSGELVSALLGLSPHDLEGKTILDLGSGDSTFSKYAYGFGSKRVISVDPTYSINSPKTTGEFVTAFGQKLPFRDDTFDLIAISNCFQWVRVGRRAMLAEALRVLHPSGEVRINPARYKKRNQNDTNIEICSSPAGSHVTFAILRKPADGKSNVEKAIEIDKEVVLEPELEEI